jgi:hypothetical protein
MNENDTKEVNLENDELEQPIEVELEDEIESSEDVDDVETLKKRISTLQAQKEHWRKKANKDPKEVKPVTLVKKEEAIPTLSLKEQLAIVKADVNPEDIDEVIDFASYKKISVIDALKHPVVKNLLQEKDEFRKSAKASHTSNKRPSGKVTDETILQNASKGVLPESDEDMERLFNARHGLR